MKYHFKIINTTTGKVVEDSAEHQYVTGHSFEGYKSEKSANIVGSNYITCQKLEFPEQYEVQVYPVPETVTEEDELDGHETWPEEQHEDTSWEQELFDEIHEHLKDRGDIWETE